MTLTGRQPGRLRVRAAAAPGRTFVWDVAEHAAGHGLKLVHAVPAKHAQLHAVRGVLG